jgi:hypothetical protein
MRRSLTKFGALALIAICSATQARAGIVYSNGPINGTLDALGIYADPFSGSNQISDSFFVADNYTQLSGAQNVGLWVTSGETLTSVDWSIGTFQFGNDIASGTAAITSTSFGTASIFDVYAASFSLSGTLSASMTYWLTLANAKASNDGQVYWDVNSGSASAFNRVIDSGPVLPPTSIDSESFQLLGEVGAAPATPEPGAPDPAPVPPTAAVPEPGTLGTVAFGLIAVLGVAARRKMSPTA